MFLSMKNPGFKLGKSHMNHIDKLFIFRNEHAFDFCNVSKKIYTYNYLILAS